MLAKLYPNIHHTGMLKKSSDNPIVIVDYHAKARCSVAYYFGSWNIHRSHMLDVRAPVGDHHHHIHSLFPIFLWLTSSWRFSSAGWNLRHPSEPLGIIIASNRYLALSTAEFSPTSITSIITLLVQSSHSEKKKNCRTHFPFMSSS